MLESVLAFFKLSFSSLEKDVVFCYNLVVSCGGFMSVKKNKRKRKHIVGTKELIFDIVSVV